MRIAQRHTQAFDLWPLRWPLLVDFDTCGDDRESLVLLKSDVNLVEDARDEDETRSLLSHPEEECARERHEEAVHSLFRNERNSSPAR